MYEHLGEVIKYRGKKTKADPQSFQELLYELARDKDSVFYKGKPQSQIDPASFKVVDEFFARDADTVFLIQDKKLKPTKADSATFQSLGFGYARDEKLGYWKDKSLKGDPSKLEPFAFNMALDHKGVLWTTRRILKSPPSRVGLRGRSDNHYEAFFWNEEGVWFSQHFWKAEQLPEVNPSSFQVLPNGFSRDRHNLFQGSQHITNLAEGEPIPLDPEWELVQVGKKTVYRKFLLDCDPESVHLLDCYPMDRSGVYQPNGDLISRFQQDGGADSETTLRSALGYQLALLETCPPIGNRPDLKALKPRGTQKLRISWQGSLITVDSEFGSFEGSWSTLPELASRIFTAQHYTESFQRFLHETGVMLPNGDLQEKLLFRSGPDWVDALKREAPECLPTAARQMMKSVYGEGREPFFGHFDYHSLEPCTARRPLPSATTNQARAKEILSKGEHCSENPAQRHDAALELYGLTEESPKTKGFLKKVMPAVLEQLELEADPALRTRWLAILDIAMANVILKADRGEALYAEALPYLNRLCEERFNLDLNLARLSEALEYLGKPEDAAATREALQKLVGDKRLSANWSGLNLDYPNVEAWLLTSKLRLLQFQSPERRLEAIEELLQNLESQIEDWREPHVLADFLCDIDRLVPLRELGRPLSWEGEPIYTRLGAIEYLLNTMPYQHGEVHWNQDGFLVKGWPWSRQVRVQVGQETTTAFLGMRRPWPKGEQKVTVLT